MKKFISILLTLVLMCSAISCMAARGEVEEFLINGDFETLNAKSGLHDAWGGIKEEHLEKENVKNGQYCLKIECTEQTGAAAYVTQVLQNLDPKQKYTLSFAYKSTDGKNPMLKLSFRTAAGDIVKEIDLGGKELGEGTKQNTWDTFSYVLTPPEKASSATLYVRGRAIGTTSWYDDISVKGIPAPIVEYEVKNPASGASELLLNTSFEDGTENYTPYQNSWETLVKIDETKGHTGSKSLKVSTDEGGLPWARQQVSNVTGETEYQMSFYYMAENISGHGVAVKLEFYDKDNNYLYGTEMLSPYQNNTKGDWRRSGLLFTTPRGAHSITLYFRLYANGTVWYDDVSLYRTGEAPKITLATDWTFFYPDIERGYVTAFANLADYPQLEGCEVYASLLDGDKELEKSPVMYATKNPMPYAFKVANMTEKKKPYTIRVSIMKDGKEEAKAEKTIYVYDRPDMIEPNGLLNINGKTEVAMMGYHMYQESTLAESVKAGVNVAQAMGGNVEGIKKYLDNCEKYGIRGIVTLYRNMKPAGEESNLERTKEIVTALKDHKGLLGWLIADEPYLYMADAYDALVTSYKTIRDIDPVHPTFIQCDDSGRKWGDCAECCDALIIHNYPIKKNPQDIAAAVSKSVINARDSVDRDSFPIWFLGQSFGNDRNQSNAQMSEASLADYILPTVAEYRKILYAAAWQGVEGLGTYSFAEDGWEITEDFSKPLLDGMQTFAKNELPLLNKAFIEDAFVPFGRIETDDLWAATFMDGNDMYLFAINAKKGEAADVEIPLVSENGLCKVGSFTATLIGGEGTASISGTEKITLSIPADDVLVYKLNVGSIDTSLLSVDFTDIDNYDWAKEDIMALYEKGIVNSMGDGTYAPGEAITRGDFAMFFMRALGLPIVETTAFTDVDGSKEYAKYITAGKYYGILNGVGDNKYNPEATITRQDLMTIIARGMALKGKTDLSSFSDNSLIADYAKAHVEAIVAAGIIKGNADGTINPIGNTTRAEAAVIMSRIMAQ